MPVTRGRQAFAEQTEIDQETAYSGAAIPRARLPTSEARALEMWAWQRHAPKSVVRAGWSSKELDIGDPERAASA
jgi:hypothetical protein